MCQHRDVITSVDRFSAPSPPVRNDSFSLIEPFRQSSLITIVRVTTVCLRWLRCRGVTATVTVVGKCWLVPCCHSWAGGPAPAAAAARRDGTGESVPIVVDIWRGDVNAAPHWRREPSASTWWRHNLSWTCRVVFYLTAGHWWWSMDGLHIPLRRALSSARTPFSQHLDYYVAYCVNELGQGKNNCFPHTFL